MKHAIFPLIFLIYLICITICSCKKPGVDLAVGNPIIPAITAVGTPSGVEVTTEIGPAGGKITSSDGKISVIVPAGAVSQNTVFRVQPITNNCPNGRAAFRLSPSGENFSQPVTIIFPYTDEDMNGAAPEMQAIAYQDVSGIWFRLPSADINTANKTISVKTKHFTDWAVLDVLRMEPGGSSSVKTGKNLSIWVTGALTTEEVEITLPALPTNNPSAEDDDLPPLPESVPFKSAWFVNDKQGGNGIVGTISTSGDNNTALYTAPSKVPSPSTVIAKAELSGFKWTFKMNGKVTTFNKVTLLKQIRVTGDELLFSLVYRTEHPGYDKSQTYTDQATMDIEIKDDKVTISNIQNQAATLTPAIQNLGGGCIMTSSPGQNGEINVTGAVGITGITTGGGSEGFTLKITDSGCWTVSSVIACPGTNPQNSPSQTFPSTTVEYVFELKNEVQKLGSGLTNTTLTITPK